MYQTSSSLEGTGHSVWVAGHRAQTQRSYFPHPQDEKQTFHIACSWVESHQKKWKTWIKPSSFFAYMLPSPHTWSSCLIFACIQMGVGILLFALNSKCVRTYLGIYKVQCLRKVAFSVLLSRTGMDCARDEGPAGEGGSPLVP